MNIKMTPRRMEYRRKYIAAGMNEEEIAASIEGCRPVMRWHAAGRARVAGYMADGLTQIEMAKLEGVKLQALQCAISKYGIKPPEPPPPEVPILPPPRPSAYRLAEFDPVIRRACENYDQSRRAA